MKSYIVNKYLIILQRIYVINRNNMLDKIILQIKLIIEIFILTIKC